MSGIATYARERMQAALSGLLDDAADADVLGDAELAVMALHLHYGSTAAVSLMPGDVVEYLAKDGSACICPDGLAARGGFRSGCPVHHHAGRWPGAS